MIGYVYLLLSGKDGKTYVGSTTDIQRRYELHCAGEVKSTRDRRPLRLIYSESFATLSLSRQRERYLKTRQGRRELKRIFSTLKI